MFNITVIGLPTSPTYCCYTTLRNINCCIGQHRARQTIELLQRKIRNSSCGLLASENSPDLSPVDCRMWGTMQDRVSDASLRRNQSLRQRLIDTWNSLSQSIVDGAIDQWRKRLQVCVNEKGDVLNTCYSNLNSEGLCR